VWLHPLLLSKNILSHIHGVPIKPSDGFADAAAILMTHCVGAARAVLQRGSVDTWRTPNSGQGNCKEVCQALGLEWHPVNGGSPGKDWLMCAGQIDMPGLGERWVVGTTLAIQNLCHIKCPTKSCFKLPPGATYDYDTFMAGSDNPWTAADGSIQLKKYVMSCACACCSGAGCEAASQDPLWRKPQDSAKCAPVNIGREAASPGSEAQPQVVQPLLPVHSTVCRSVKKSDSGQPDSTYGQTGWVDTSVTPSVCRNPFMSVAEYEVWCPTIKP
jgi:hypothetical protein